MPDEASDAAVEVSQGVITSEILWKAQQVEELTGHPVALDVDAILSAATLYDMLSEKGKRGTRGAFEEQGKALDRVIRDRS
jgi:hypothetical protein